MPIGSRLTHTVSVARDVESGAFDDYNQPVTNRVTVASVRAAIQSRLEKSAFREADVVSDAGAVTADYTVYLLPLELTTADSIAHDPAVCPLANDLPAMHFEIEGIRNAAGLGHHLEVECRVVASPAEAEGS